MSSVIVNRYIYPYLAEQHANHLVDSSPWPIITSFSLLQLAIGLSKYFQYYNIDYLLSFLMFISLSFNLYCWFSDIVMESTIEGNHTKAVQANINLGMILFIASEVMFFFALFWSFFHFSLSPSIWIGAVWPPQGIHPLDPFGLPLLNTVILLSSGVSITLAHRALACGDLEYTTLGLLVTLLYGAVFSIIQAYEYNTALFSINDGVFGSIFYLCTGFHGFHVFIGSIFIAVCLGRNLLMHFTVDHHVGFLCAAYYWHFVDVVWLFLWVYVYWWSSGSNF